MHAVTGLGEEHLSLEVTADLIQKRDRAGGGQPRERGPTHLQELRSAGPGLWVLIQGGLQEVPELCRPGGRGPQ